MKLSGAADVIELGKVKIAETGENDRLLKFGGLFENLCFEIACFLSCWERVWKLWMDFDRFYTRSESP